LQRYTHALAGIKRQRKLQELVNSFSRQHEFSQLIKPLGSRPLVLSAYPGNEVMAMGGTMGWYAKMEHSVTVLTFSHGCCGTNTGEFNKGLGLKRKKEQKSGCKAIGNSIKHITWDLDEKFLLTQELVFSLTESIDEINPDIIYCPSLLESQPDNQTISQALAQSLQRLPSPRLRDLWVAQYELWSPLIPNRILNIDEFVDAKTKAIECHESQLLCRDYLEAMKGLNRYRAAILGAGNTAEAFYISKAKHYISLVTEPVPTFD